MHAGKVAALYATGFLSIYRFESSSKAVLSTTFLSPGAGFFGFGVFCTHHAAVCLEGRRVRRLLALPRVVHTSFQLIHLWNKRNMPEASVVKRFRTSHGHG